jgi:DNA-binding response OmpR family regulator
MSTRNLQNRTCLIIAEKWANWLPSLLKSGAFDVMLGQVRYLELYGKLQYFFSDNHQIQLFKQNPPFKIDFTRKEQQLFDFLVAHPLGVSREELMTLCWKNISVHPKTLDVHLFNLRQKLEDVSAGVRFNGGKWHLDLGGK